MNFRLTQGVNGTLFGEQYVVIEDEAENAVEFARKCLNYAAGDLKDTSEIKLITREFLYNCWINAGEILSRLLLKILFSNS